MECSGAGFLSAGSVASCAQPGVLRRRVGNARRPERRRARKRQRPVGRPDVAGPRLPEDPEQRGAGQLANPFDGGTMPGPWGTRVPAKARSAPAPMASEQGSEPLAHGRQEGIEPVAPTPLTRDTVSRSAAFSSRQARRPGRCRRDRLGGMPGAAAGAEAPPLPAVRRPRASTAGTEAGAIAGAGRLPAPRPGRPPRLVLRPNPRRRRRARPPRPPPTLRRGRYGYRGRIRGHSRGRRDAVRHDRRHHAAEHHAFAVIRPGRPGPPGRAAPRRFTRRSATSRSPRTSRLGPRTASSSTSTTTTI